MNKSDKRIRKRIILTTLAAAVILAVVLTGISLWQLERSGDDIVVLYTNDVHCRVDENIGYAGLALYEKQLQQETQNVFLVDVGDAVQGAPIGTLSSGKYIIDIMNHLEYDFAVPGNHEFDYGISVLNELAQKLNCGYYSCNFLDTETGKPVFEPYKMFSCEDTEIAFVGVTTPESLTKSTPTYFQDEQGNYLYEFCEDETGEALYAQVQSSVNKAKADGADYVILAGHLGGSGVTDYWSSDQIIANTEGIDVCIDGHSHEAVPHEIVKNKNGEDVVVTQTGSQMEAIGKLTISEDGTIETELIYEIPFSDSIDGAAKTEDGKAVDSSTRDFIVGIQNQYAEQLKMVVGRTQYALTVNDPDTGERAIRNNETNLGDFVADAFRIVLGADIGLCNGGGIREDIQPGDITYNDILMVFPYGNTGCVIEVTGQQIKDALEMGVRGLPEESGSFLQVSGLSYQIDTSIPSSVQTDDKGNFKGVSGDYRVTDLRVNGEPIELTATYTIASHNYTLKEHGGGMTMLQDCRVLKDEVMLDADILIAYLKQTGGEITSEYENPAGQGRIIIN